MLAATLLFIVPKRHIFCSSIGSKHGSVKCKHACPCKGHEEPRCPHLLLPQTRTHPTLPSVTIPCLQLHVATFSLAASSLYIPVPTPFPSLIHTISLLINPFQFKPKHLRDRIPFTPFISLPTLHPNQNDADD